MKNLMLSGFAILLLSSFAFVTTTSWTISSDYQLQFDAKKAVGNFSKMEGSIHFDPNDLANSKFDMWVDVSTIDTGNKTKNKHAVGKKWFDIEQFPKVTFQSKQISRKEEGYETSGTLTIRDISQEITFPFTFSPEGDGGIFEGSFSLDRKSFDLNGPALYGSFVGKEVTVNIRVPVELN